MLTVKQVLDDLTQTLRGDHYQNSKVDPDIRDILNKYQTLPDKQLPGLQDLHRHVLMAVETRDQNWYRHHLRITDASESDDRIQEIVSKYILNPPEGTSSNFCLGP